MDQSKQSSFKCTYILQNTLPGTNDDNFICAHRYANKLTRFTQNIMLLFFFFFYQKYYHLLALSRRIEAKKNAVTTRWPWRIAQKILNIYLKCALKLPTGKVWIKILKHYNVQRFKTFLSVLIQVQYVMNTLHVVQCFKFSVIKTVNVFIVFALKIISYLKVIMFPNYTLREIKTLM